MVDYNKIFGVEDSYKAPEKIMEVLYDKEKREKLFMELLEVHDYDVDFDWFYTYFQEEHADRKNKKQDFTPKSVAKLLSGITMSDDSNDKGLYYECCAGTGGIMVTHWNNYRRQFSPFDYTPDLQYAVVEELSDRCIPFLLLNMMIRGMNGVVVHGDCLTRKCKNAYFICNTKNDHLQFSSISNVPHTEFFEEELSIKFESKEYIEHKELMDMDIISELLGKN
ncbi:MAG: N-6 DNA methylase [Clostridium chrysemydis]|uniref:N-6 DNA methylase n=1 Tax=Clostridium chrysemydis TaxID=2665504 RepID=UPI003F2D7D52